MSATETPALPRLVGPELLSFVTENIALSRSNLARKAGYTRWVEPKDGGEAKEQVLVQLFQDALLEAQGMNLRKRAGAGKTPGFSTSVHSNGTVLIGKSYIDQLKLTPGDVLSIAVEGEEIKLTLQSKGPGVSVDDLKKASESSGDAPKRGRKPKNKPNAQQEEENRLFGREEELPETI